mmetsp:Transcript_14668/g.42935  ORF Transcript_14668/g.42935 Transcript_14668/m.42935 type:complete len:208 (+) Transcript_14668:398-1021(+)
MLQGQRSKGQVAATSWPAILQGKQRGTRQTAPQRFKPVHGRPLAGLLPPAAHAVAAEEDQQQARRGGLPKAANLSAMQSRTGSCYSCWRLTWTGSTRCCRRACLRAAGAAATAATVCIAHTRTAASTPRWRTRTLGGAMATPWPLLHPHHQPAGRRLAACTCHPWRRLPVRLPSRLQTAPPAQGGVPPAAALMRRTRTVHLTRRGSG